MTAGRYNITIEQGATFSLNLTWDDSTSTPVNLDTYLARMSVRKGVSSAEIVSLTTENGRITLGGILGTIDLLILASDTAALPAGEYVYDLEMIDGLNVVRLLEGRCTIKAEVTR